MAPILEVVRKHNLRVIEAAAEARGAEYQGRKVEEFCDIGCFSLCATKIVTTSEGEMHVTLTLNSDEWAKELRDTAFGKESIDRFEHGCVGFNYRLSSGLAALGLSQLKRISECLRRRVAARLYNKLLESAKGLETPNEPVNGKSVYWMHSVLINHATCRRNRADLIQPQEKFRIEARPFFVPVHRQPAFLDHHRSERYPESESRGKSGLNLPPGNTLTRSQVECVAQTIAGLAIG